MMIRWRRQALGIWEWREDAIPPHVMTLVDVIGVDSAARLIEHFGGRTNHLAKNPRATSEMVQLIGMEAARALSAKCGPGSYLIPRASPFLTQWIRSTENASVAELSRRIGLHERTVSHHLARGVRVDV